MAPAKLTLMARSCRQTSNINLRLTDHSLFVQVELENVKTKSGEENLECIMKIRVKLFRWRDEQWKERGIGNAKLMRDRAEKRIRFIMRQEKTLKPVANFLGK